MKKENGTTTATRSRKRLPKGPMYPNDTPLDEHGRPLENVPMSVEQVRRMGALDSESARVTQMHRNVMSAKAAGEPVVWSPDPRIALEEIYSVYPSAKLEIVQIQPKRDDKIPSRPLSFIHDYDALRRYLMEAHWNRKEDAVYQWFARAPGLPQIGTGTIHLAREEEDQMRQSGNGGGFGGYGGYPPQYGPPQGYGPQQYWPTQPPVYQQAPPQQFAPPAPAPAPAPVSAAPQSFESQPAAQPYPVINADGTQAGWLINGVFYAIQSPSQQPAPQAQPVAPAPLPVPQVPQPQQGGDFQTFLVTQLLELAKQNTAFTEQMRHLYDQRHQQQPSQPFLPTYSGLTPVSYGVPPGLHVGQPAQVATPAQQATPAQPEKPLTAAEQMKQQMADQIAVLRVQKEFSDTVRAMAGVSDEDPETPAPPAPVVSADEDFPIKIKEINGVTVGSVDGEVMSVGEMTLLNAPKLLMHGMGFLDNLFSRFEKAKTEKKKEVDDDLEKRRQEVELQERAAQARKAEQDAKVAFEQKRLEIRAAHQFLDTQASPPPPPSPVSTPARVDIVPPPPQPVMAAAIEPEPRVEATSVPEEVLEEEPDPPQIPDPS